MGRRGRPPYPDILTPRQWEVLDLVRHGLSDQEIANALDLTLAGAKYHVSEILTKLGVASREEAAAWQPPETRKAWWRRALALSLAVKIAGAAVVIAAAAGIGVLAWGTLRTDDSGKATAASVFGDLGLPVPVTPLTLTREQALAKSAETLGYELRLSGSRLAAIDVQSTTLDGALPHVQGVLALPGFEGEPTVWFVRARMVTDQYIDSYPNGQTPPPPVLACRDGTGFVFDSASITTNVGVSGRGRLPDSACDFSPTSDWAIVEAALALIPYSVVNYWSVTLPTNLSADPMSLSEAISRLQAARIDATGLPSVSGHESDQVWLVSMSGRFEVTTPAPTPVAPGVTPIAKCHIAMAIVSADGVLAAGSAPSTDC